MGGKGRSGVVRDRGLRVSDCPHESYEVLVFEPVEWQEDVVHMTMRNESTGEIRQGGWYAPGHNDICICTDCGLVATRRGTFTVAQETDR